MDVSVIGIGKLGLPMIACFASGGNSVLGIDNSQNIVDAVNRGECPIEEPGLEDLLQRYGGQITCSTNFSSVKDTNITFIIVPTPTDDTGEFTNSYILSVLEKLGEALAKKEDYHLVVVTSTVKLGSMRDEFAPLLERTTGKKVGKGVGLCYGPEFIALGNVIHGIIRPDALLIGESDVLSGDMLETFYCTVCPDRPPVHRMTWENAEVSKLMLNVFITTKISMANTFANVCSRIPNGDVDAVCNFLGSDARIGNKYLKGGPGFAGPCFPRDNRAFAKMCVRIGLPDTISGVLQQEVDFFNEEHNLTIVEDILHIIPKGAGVASLLGVSYKPDTPVTEESPAIIVADCLMNNGLEVRAYDPLARLPQVKMADTLAKCLQGSDVAIILTPWGEFGSLAAQDFYVMKHPIVYDCWRLLDRSKLKGIEYHALGVSDDKR